MSTTINYVNRIQRDYCIFLKVQITGKNDNEEYAYGGSLNTSSKQKTASITIMLEYQEYLKKNFLIFI